MRVLASQVASWAAANLQLHEGTSFNGSEEDRESAMPLVDGRTGAKLPITPTLCKYLRSATTKDVSLRYSLQTTGFHAGRVWRDKVDKRAVGVLFFTSLIFRKPHILYP